MLHYVFQSEQDALAAERRIVANVRQWAAENAPDALSDDGSRLRGRNAQTGEFADAYTDRWAVPYQISDGRWVFAVPTDPATFPIPAAVFTAGVEAETAVPDETWLLVPGDE